MRSLWKSRAMRWLGGRASEALSAETGLDGWLSPAPGPAFLVQRTEVSHHAMMSEHTSRSAIAEILPEPTDRERGRG